MDANGFYFRSGREFPSTIHVEFINRNDFYSDAGATSWGDYIQMSRGNFLAYTDDAPEGANYLT